MRKYITLGFILILSVACTTPDSYKDIDIDGQNLYEQQAIIYKSDGNNKKQASFYDISSTIMEKGDQEAQVQHEFFLTLIKENFSKFDFEVISDFSVVDQYNNTYGTNYKKIPIELVDFTPTLTVESGEIISSQGSLTIHYSDDLMAGHSYLLPLSLKSIDSNVKIMESSNNLLYAIEISSGLITKSTLLTRDTYFKINKNNSIINDISGVFTLEGLICVNKFRDENDVGDVQISTFIGTEGDGMTLLRFGDAGIPGNHLQANEYEIEIDFQTNKWYHIALVVDNGESIVYINGEEVISFWKNGSLGEFYIGRSYNDDRGIEARVSELRIWQTARTPDEIKECMYGAKDLTGIYAYWKMNQVKDGKIEDISGNENHLELWGQANATGRQPIKIIDEKGIDVE